MGNPIFQKGSPTPLFTVKKEVFSWLRDGSKTIDVRKGTPRRGSIAFFQSGKNHLRQHIVKTETGALTDVIRKDNYLQVIPAAENLDAALNYFSKLYGKSDGVFTAYYLSPLQ